MAGPPAPWDLCLLRLLALAFSPRAGKGFPEPHPSPLTARPARHRRLGWGVSLRPGWPPFHWAQEMASREVRCESPWEAPRGSPWAEVSFGTAGLKRPLPCSNLG